MSIIRNLINLFKSQLEVEKTHVDKIVDRPPVQMDIGNIERLLTSTTEKDPNDYAEGFERLYRTLVFETLLEAERNPIPNSFRREYISFLDEYIKRKKTELYQPNLTQRERIALYLIRGIYFEKHSLSKAVKRLGCSPINVRALEKDARKKIRDMIKYDRRKIKAVGDLRRYIRYGQEWRGIRYYDPTTSINPACIRYNMSIEAREEFYRSLRDIE